MLTRPLRLIAVFACAAMLGLHPAAAQHKLENLPALIPTLLPQVVNISFLRHQTPGDKLKAMEEQVKSLAPTGAGVGTGFIVDALGIICTNRHVTDGGDEIYVTLSDNVRLRAELIYRSPDIDLALLRVKPPRLLTPVKFGDSDDMIQGTEVIAIGNPLGLGGTVTTGIVSARDRDIQETALDSFMQIDASINPGNSGGPLFNAAGELIGMNTALFTVSTSGAPAGSIGLNFAIPGNDVKLVLDQLRETGRVRHGQLGATVQDISPDLAEAVGLSTVTGAIVTYLSPNSPATAADLRDGDVILKLNDVVVSSSRAARRFILSHPGAKGIRIQVLRDGTETTLSADLLEVSAGPERVDMAMLPVAKMRITAMDLGVEAAPMNPALRAKFNIPPEIDGVVITQVVSKGLGDYLGLRAGSVVMKAQSTPIHEGKDFIQVAERALRENRSRIPVLVYDETGSRWIALPVNK
jgi:serine protease Do